MFSSLYNNSFGEHSNLEQVTEKYPYFSAAHFFLLKKTKPGDAGYDSIAAKTALHFANPYLLRQQLEAPPVQNVTEEAMAAEPQQTEYVISGEEADDVSAENNFDHRVEVMEITAEEDVKTMTDEKTPEEPAVIEAVADVPDIVAGPAATPEKKQEEHPPLLFEPLHTTDYFASQGIKLSEVILPNDKIGRQLKSFTEWLKTMKKVHPDGTKDKNDANIDPSVQNLAEKSNKEEDVITEAMAIVYLQQGKTNKAKEIYEKLSLQNPSKSAYFAAKLSEIQ